eukprot:3298188-Rhodomonas_salina.2
MFHAGCGADRAYGAAQTLWIRTLMSARSARLGSYAAMGWWLNRRSLARPGTLSTGYTCSGPVRLGTVRTSQRRSCTNAVSVPKGRSARLEIARRVSTARKDTTSRLSGRSCASLAPW